MTPWGGFEMGKVVIITTKQAQELMKKEGLNSVSEPTIISWCRDKGIGHQIAGRGRWYINKTLFMGLIRGK